MRYATFTETEESSYPVALLVPTIRKEEIRDAYLSGPELDAEDVLVLDLHSASGKKKTPVKEIKGYIEEMLVPSLTDMGVEYVLCAQSDYFKALAGVSKAEANAGYVLDSPYGDFKVIYIPNYRSIFYDPDKVKIQIQQGLSALAGHRNQGYQAPGSGIIHFAAYPQTDEEIEEWLNKLLTMNSPLAIDIEAFSLKHHTAGIGTITFCWSKHEGIAFPVDYVPIPGAKEAPYGQNARNERRRKLLRDFFRAFTKKALYHNISYDVYVLIYQLFMDDILDTGNLLHGLEVMLQNWDDTKLITYLATNSCAGNELGLKIQAQEFAGNYGQDDIKDITRIPLPDLLQYNLVDGLSTWFVYEKHWDTMIADEQEEIYNTIFKPAIVDIIQMQLTGLPLNMERVLEVKEVLTEIEADALDRMNSSPIIVEFTQRLREEHVRERNSKLKKKQITLAYAECEKVIFNPNSGPQLQSLLFDMLELPVLALTDSKLPSTDKDTIEDLRNHTTVPEIKEFLQGLQDYKAVSKILTAFIPAFENAAQGPDGWHYLFGNFNLGGTLSGRLSSSDPNLQNLPANVFMVVSQALQNRFADILGPYMKKGKLGLGKLIKSCFQAPPGWIFAGLDFDSLEDRISALTTKDPNKLKVYQGHVIYRVELADGVHHIRDDDLIVFNGNEYSGAQFYEAHSSGLL